MGQAHWKALADQYKIDHACKVSENRIKSGKFQEAKIELENAEALVIKYPDCQIISSRLDSLLKLYQPLFRYIQAFDSLQKSIGKIPFLGLKKWYEDLQNDFDVYELNKYLE